jgi:excisionase family DNA binding protein
MANQPMTPSQAAVLLGVGQRHIRQQIADGRLSAELIDGRIMVDPIVVAERFKLELDSGTVGATTLDQLRERAACVGYALDELELIESARALLRQTYHLEPCDAASRPMQKDQA